MRADRAQHQPQADAADHPRARVEHEQRRERRRPQRRQLAMTEAPQDARRGPVKDARVQQRCDHEREQHDRRDRRVDAVHPDQRDHEHEHARDGREAGLDRHRRRDERRVVHARAPQRDHPRGGRPHSAGDVLGQHRDHLRAQRDRVVDPHAPVGEDPDPADDEDEVVRGDGDAGEHEQHRVGVAEISAGGMEGAPHGPRDRAEKDREQAELPRDEQLRVRLQARCDSSHSHVNR